MKTEFGTLFHFIRNGMNIRQDKSGDGLPITRIETISDSNVDASRVGYAGLSEAQCADWLLVTGDILFSHINSVEHIGKCAVYRGEPNKLVHGMNLLCLRSNHEKVVPEYAKYLIRSKQFRAKLSNSIKRAVNQASVSISDLKSILVDVPPLAEQKRIAAILDKADGLRAARRAALEKLDTLTQSIFLEMFGDPASNDSGSHKGLLGDYLEFMTTGGRGWAKYYAPQGSRFIRSLDVQMNYIGEEEVVYVAAPDNAEAKRTQVREDDVLLTMTGSRIGRVSPASAEIDGAFISQHVAILRINISRLRPRFLAFFLSLPGGGQKQIARWQYGQTKPGLNFEQVRRFVIPIPDIALQLEFERRVDSVTKLKEAICESANKFYALFSSLQHRAFRGEL